MQTAVPSNIRLPNGKVPAFLKGAQFQIPKDVDESDSDDSSSDNFLLGDNADDDITAGIAADMLEIKERLRVETEFEGIDEWDLQEHEFERAMELGLLPLPMIADYVADMVILAKCRKLGRPIPLWAVRLIEASTLVQRRWREKAKDVKFKGHAAAVDALFTGSDFTDFSKATKDAQKVECVAKKADDSPEDRFWKAYMQHVKRVHAGQKSVESDSVFERRVEKSMSRLKTSKYLKSIKSAHHHDGLLLSPSPQAASKAKAKPKPWA